MIAEYPRVATAYTDDKKPVKVCACSACPTPTKRVKISMLEKDEVPSRREVCESEEGRQK